MKPSARSLTVFFAFWSFGVAVSFRAQEPSAVQSTRTIDENRGAPIKGAIETLRKRYDLPITYQDPVYACPCDLSDMTYTRKKPGPKIIVPKRRQFHFEYVEVNGKPQEQITPLLGRLVAQFAAEGGPVFSVRERTIPEGTQWDVIPVQARGSLGNFEDQPDILNAPIFIPKGPRYIADFLTEMVQQLKTETRYEIVVGSGTNSMSPVELGADNIPARDVLANLLYAEKMVWELNYDPEEGGGKYFLNLVRIAPPVPYSLDAFTVPPRPTTTMPHGPPPVFYRSPLALRVPSGRIELQSKLAQLGYYTGQPTGQWDQNTQDALKKFQAASNLPVTGMPDHATLQKLGLFSGTSPQ